MDIGCGFGGLLMSLATAFPEKMMLGMEIRTKVCEYVHQKVSAATAVVASCVVPAAFGNVRRICIRGRMLKALDDVHLLPDFVASKLGTGRI